MRLAEAGIRTAYSGRRAKANTSPNAQRPAVAGAWAITPPRLWLLIAKKKVGHRLGPAVAEAGLTVLRAAGTAVAEAGTAIIGTAVAVGSEPAVAGTKPCERALQSSLPAVQ